MKRLRAWFLRRFVQPHIEAAVVQARDAWIRAAYTQGHQVGRDEGFAAGQQHAFECVHAYIRERTGVFDGAEVTQEDLDAARKVVVH